VLGAALIVFSTFNKLVSLKNGFQNAFAQIDVQAKRRYDLIPNLVESVKGYMAHERGTLEAVISARNSAHAANAVVAASPINPSAMKSFITAETALSAGIGRLMAVMENYPQLQANEPIRALMEELTTTENRISFARQAFNDTAMEYNTACQRFPGFIIAGVAGFKETPLFRIEKPEEREAPKVSLSGATSA